MYDHSVKNIVLYALILEAQNARTVPGAQAGNQYKDAIQAFVKLFAPEGTLAVVRDRLAMESTAGLELIALTSSGDLLVGQEEITQNVQKQAIVDMFLVQRAGAYDPQSVSADVDGNDAAQANSEVVQRLSDLDRENESRDTKHIVVVGPGSQFASPKRWGLMMTRILTRYSTLSIGRLRLSKENRLIFPTYLILSLLITVPSRHSSVLKRRNKNNSKRMSAKVKSAIVS
jgi:hypothetical protein